MNRRGLRALFYLGGVVATGAGLSTVIAGARSLPGQMLANPRLCRLRRPAKRGTAAGAAAQVMLLLAAS